jgi:hypothetical protein
MDSSDLILDFLSQPKASKMFRVIPPFIIPQIETWVMVTLSWAWDVTGESTDALKGSCSQNTLKNKKLEH